MPELPEVHRATHFLRRFLVQPGIHTLTSVSYYSPPDKKDAATATTDAKIFDTAKTGTDAPTFCAQLEGKKVKDIGRLGKYFWLEMESAPHPLFHFGMTGWIKYKGSKDKGVDYWEGKRDGRKDWQQAKGNDDPLLHGEDNEGRPHKIAEQEWPPRFAKVLFEATSERGEVTHFAFIDSRRFAKLLLVHPTRGKGMRETEPLSLNGPDPVLEADRITSSWLSAQMAKRKAPIKAFLLDQRVMSGVGNWVADEVLFHARIHPESNANTLDENQTERLVEQLKFVCKIAAIDALGDSHHFPDDWLMRHRWRLDKTGNTGMLPCGEKVIRITVGGRTSAIVPSLQGGSPSNVITALESKAIKPKIVRSKKRKASPAKEEQAADSENAIYEPKDSTKRSRRSNTRISQTKTQKRTTL